MKTLKDLAGVKALSKNEQRALKGGLIYCDCYEHPNCPPLQHCQLIPGACVGVCQRGDE